MLHLKFLKILLSNCFIIFLLCSNYNTVIAEEKNDNLEKAIQTAPRGLNWNNDAFTIADFHQASEQRKKNHSIQNFDITKIIDDPGRLINHSKIVQSKNPKSPNTSIIQLTDATHQTGAVWSNMSKLNYFDISHEQTASMWIYFGKNYNTNTTVSPLVGDGMAFVLQNDPNGVNSIALSDKGIPADGQSLGVWGPDWDISNDDKNKLSGDAIQNSWALEFDTYSDHYFNNLTGKGTAFDTGISTHHIAANYPANPKTYIHQQNTQKQNYFILSHIMPNDKDGLKKINSGIGLVDNKWHHITITWKPINETKGTLTYAYDDKDVKSGFPLSTIYTYSYTIDTNYFGLKDNKKNIYWGFTGSTGDNSENNLIIFESLPSFADAKVKSSIYDDSRNLEVNDSHKTVDSNSEIRYTFSLNYKGWNKDWDKVTSTMKIPDNIEFDSGSITYPDSQDDKSAQPIPKDIFDNIKNNKLHELKYDLPEKLSSTSRTAQIELRGRVNVATGSTNLKVPSVHASFEGDTLITGADTQSFEIIPKKLTLNRISDKYITVNPTSNDDIKIEEQVNYNGFGNKYSDMEIHQILKNDNGTEEKTIPRGKIGPDGKFSLSINRSSIKELNTLYLYVTYNDGQSILESNHISHIISIGGLLTFGDVQQNVTFKTISNPNISQVVSRTGPWQVTVNDSRKKGSHWYVKASSKGLILNRDKKTKLNGNLFFRHPNGKDEDIKTTPVQIASHIKESDESDSTDIVKTWNSNDGVLLFNDKENTNGIYSGDIIWSLLDTP